MRSETFSYGNNYKHNLIRRYTENYNNSFDDLKSRVSHLDRIWLQNFIQNRVSVFSRSVINRHEHKLSR